LAAAQVQYLHRVNGRIDSQGTPFLFEGLPSSVEETLLASCLLVLVAVNMGANPCDKIEENGTELGTIATPKVRDAGNSELGFIVIRMSVGMIQRVRRR
jgi:hypothetical protein